MECIKVSGQVPLCAVFRLNATSYTVNTEARGSEIRVLPYSIDPGVCVRV